MYWNPEHYPDPTDGAALRQLYRKPETEYGVSCLD